MSSSPTPQSLSLSPSPSLSSLCSKSFDSRIAKACIQQRKVLLPETHGSQYLLACACAPTCLMSTLGHYNYHNYFHNNYHKCCRNLLHKHHHNGYYNDDDHNADEHHNDNGDDNHHFPKRNHIPHAQQCDRSEWWARACGVRIWYHVVVSQYSCNLSTHIQYCGGAIW